ncbi:MAG TPA: hypothetical protein PKO23_12340 [Candidatus Hydrogenedentes bacterium]|nr:hypothetical protein [Candidatus Hydrogenedentota bacterium]
MSLFRPSIRLLLFTVSFQAAGLIADGETYCIGNAPQLFVGDALIKAKDGVIRRVHACNKLTHPVLEPEMPWEQDGDDQRIYVYGTVRRDAEDGLFHLWYNRNDLVLYAVSEDGMAWSRPELGLVELQGSKANNCVQRHFHSPSVVYTPDTERRYAMLGFKRTDGRGCYAAVSGDGLHWKLCSETPAFSYGDTCTLMFEPASGMYLAFHKKNLPWRGHERRLVYLSASRDLQTWSDSTPVMMPDEIDDAQVKREGGRYSEFYNMSVFPYGGQYLGFVTHFRFTGPPERRGPLQSNDDGPIDVQLVHSRDGRTWERCEDRSPVIPNGPHAYDAGCILGVANGVVPVNDELWTYYTAITTTHGGFVPEKRITVALAKWRMDGFVSLDTDENGGSVQTIPMAWTGDRLFVNAEAGELTVAVRDPSGMPLPGYTHAACIPVSGDSVRHTVCWKKHKTLPEGSPLCLEFRMKNARLYSFKIVSD